MLFAILHYTTHICLSFFVIILISQRSLFDEMILSHKKSVSKALVTKI